ncbi:Dipeptidyl aminopeptidase BI [Seminavis robusta]|uniref:Prolyl endopeptidase n=1 Tax=Seminavis robusta TaxID=568900 RepID=A0A9N8DCY5_9STRA|nr:Dipeptidyl aminopeptidase BI [Seminavis robusta]|eukprot:Sro62_g035520.1 Dipeptidyl aminopeptidase BI (820) ;mRNA; f:112226-114877
MQLFSLVLFLSILMLFAKSVFSFRPFFLARNLRRQRQGPSAAVTKVLFGTQRGGDLTPPPAERHEDRVIYAGVAPKGWPSDVPRQSEYSAHKLLDPPVAVPDPYGWLRDDSRTQQPVLDHLQQENDYTGNLTQHLEGLRQTLYDEMLSSIQETDYTLPRPKGKYYHYSRTFQGQSYASYCRAPRKHDSDKDHNNPLLHMDWDGSAEAPILPGEQVKLDVNELAKGKDYCAVGSVTTSPSDELLAYTVDFKGDEQCELYVKHLETGEIVDHDPSLQMYGRVLWGNDDHTIFYLKLDSTLRPYQVYRRTIGTATKEDDELLFEETDEMYWTSISKSLDGKYLFVETSSTETSEVHYLDLKDDNDSSTLQCVAKRRFKVLYDVEHRNEQWWITSNVKGTPNMRLFTAPAQPNCQDDWALVTDPTTEGTPLFDGGYARALHGVTAFAGHVVAQGREGGMPRVWLLTMDDINKVVKFDTLTFEEEAHDVGLTSHFEFDVDKIVVAYDSMITPLQYLELPLDNPTDESERTVLKDKLVPGYDKNLYNCERVMALSRDGTTEIPVNLVYRKDIMEQHVASSGGGEPVHCHLYGYGSYEACMEASFSATRLSLLNRGIVYAIAQIRGGGEMGRQWYEEPNGAKYLCKKNTFNDFVDVARYLIDTKKLTSPQKLTCEGRSAGGLLIGASINQAPELFKVAILGVPFVDVVCTMIDASIPLTTGEWEEWGNPNEEKFHEYMMEYSPMQNVKEGAIYPSCLLTGGLHDSRVAFWEPAKFAATLRHAQSPESGPVCLKMELSAGHFSASDRYKYYRELAFDYAFLLDQRGL